MQQNLRSKIAQADKDKDYPSVQGFGPVCVVRAAERTKQVPVGSLCVNDRVRLLQIACEYHRPHILIPERAVGRDVLNRSIGNYSDQRLLPPNSDRESDMEEIAAVLARADHSLHGHFTAKDR